MRAVAVTAIVFALGTAHATFAQQPPQAPAPPAEQLRHKPRDPPPPRGPRKRRGPPRLQVVPLPLRLQLPPHLHLS
jgi:hypothetical protein